MPINKDAYRPWEPEKKTHEETAGEETSDVYTGVLSERARLNIIQAKLKKECAGLKTVDSVKAY